MKRLLQLSAIAAALSLALLALISCSRLNELEEKVEWMQAKVTSLENAINSLQSAYESGKTISSIVRSYEDGLQGWKISFTDGTTLTVLNGRDGKDGTDGKDGRDGQDAASVIISSILSNPEAGILTLVLSDGTSFDFKSTVLDTEFQLSGAKLYNVRIEASRNPVWTRETIVLDNSANEYLYEGRIPSRTDLSKLKLSFDYIGREVRCSGITQTSGENENDFRRVQNFEVISADGQTTHSYSISITSFTGLPIVSISTNKVPIDSKETWVPATISITNSQYSEDFEATLSIRGRGNSTWTNAPKKPYALKLDSKASLLGMPKHKRWVLLANYFDKSYLRNAACFYMGEHFTHLDYTPRFKFVEVFLNEEYIGNYQLGEHIKIDPNRVNVSDSGYILEVDGKAAPEDILFHSPKGLPFNIKEPDMTVGSEAYNQIRDFVTKAENALYSSDFLDPAKGYKQYIDIESFVEWYLVNELTKNVDAVMHTSCYMNLAPGGKLKMGPLWDFDTSMAQSNYNNSFIVEGFYINNSRWFERLFQDPEFVSLLKTRYQEFRSHEDELMTFINETSLALEASVIENNSKWETFYKSIWENYAIWGSFSNEVQYIKNFLHRRFLWLDSAIANL